MKNLMLGIILLALSSVSLNVFSASNKVEICHKGKVISVNQSAVSGHERHGDTEGDCDDASIDPGPDKDKKAAVVMMRCEAIEGNGVEVVSASASFDFASIQPVEPFDCAVALAEMLDAGLDLHSVTSGSAEADDGNLHLYTDYLLIGELPDEDD